MGQRKWIGGRERKNKEERQEKGEKEMERYKGKLGSYIFASCLTSCSIVLP